MNATFDDRNLRPADTLADLIDRHGTWRVMLALAGHLARRRRARRLPPVLALSDHLRRDIGLPDLPLHVFDPRLHKAGIGAGIENPAFRQ